MDNPASSKPITGRTRVRTTRWTVAWIDRCARILIASGGIGTIIAVVTVFLFLTSVVFWLFVPPSVGAPAITEISLGQTVSLHMGCDEDETTAWILSVDGDLTAFRLDNGKVLLRRPLVEGEGPKLTAAAFEIDREHGIFGFADGTVRLGRIGCKFDFESAADVPESVQALKRNDVGEWDGAMVKRISEDLFHRSKFVVELEAPIEAARPSPIAKIAVIERSEGPLFCALSADRVLTINAVTKRKNLLTKKTTYTTEGGSVELPSDRRELPDYLSVSGTGAAVFVAWKDGALLRYDTRVLDKPTLNEEVKLVSERGAQLTALQLLLGGETLLAGDSLGRVRAWFNINVDEQANKHDWNVLRAGAKDSFSIDLEDSKDSSHLVPVHELSGPASAVTCLAVNRLSRVCAAGYANGQARLFFVTSEKLLANVRADERGPVRSVMIAPDGKGLFASAANGITRWNIAPGHPEVTLATLFGKVWYEGYPAPSQAWQTTGGTDAAEMKASLVPLIFGTLKATFYSMLFGAPLALMAAIFTSEFLHPRTKARVKPIIEMMASLPSVVLGFLAGVIFAKMLERVVPEVMTSLFTVPLAFMTGAFLWQFLPRNVALRFQRAKLACIAILLPVGIFAGFQLGPQLQNLLFAGDLKAWLANPDKERYSNGIGGWIMLMLPLAALITAVFISRVVSPFVRRYTQGMPRSKLVLIDFIKFIGGIVVCIVAALFMAAFLYYVLGIDPRYPNPNEQQSGMRFHPLSKYEQRNALILGAMMGFAIIPIIYTVAEDALSSVPQHLRSASLGAGATAWQTAIRIVIPTAMSGLFSAVMIGLGRAVGETMIVLMAAGNVSIMDFNFFNGFQTLSAAIATELSEAPSGSTHFRVLFLAGLALFVITFIVNTVAEVVRLRFRRRSHEL